MSGSLASIAGATVVARGLEGAALHEVVRVGRAGLLGEVVRIERDCCTIQVYEETLGLAPGEPANATAEPLVVELGPGLRGRVFDGLQRPLADLARSGGDFLARGAFAPALDRDALWDFESALRPGDAVEPGALLGTARPAGGGAPEPVLVPPGVRGVVRTAGPCRATVIDPVVRLEDGATLALSHRWPVRVARPVRRRLTCDLPFLTGQRVLDCFFPVAAGGAAIVPGGFGTGKTVLEQALAKFAAADVIVYVGCGERGNEMTELLDEFPRLADPRSGRPLLERTVLVVNTSNMPVAAREASMYTGVTIAEYFRDCGLQVALMVDSTSRWAEALREMGSRLAEMPGEEGYPTYLGTRLLQFYERAGRAVPLSGAGEGSITIVGAVSPAGGDFSEPVTQASLRAAAALWALSPELAQRRHFPAIDWSRSFTLDAPRLDAWFAREAGADWAERRDEAMRLLQREHELDEIAQLVGVEALRDPERIVLEAARLLREGFLRQNALHPVDASCPPAKTILMLRAILHWARGAAAAVERGVPLRAILSTGLDRRLVRLGETPAADLAAAAPALAAEIEATLAGLERA